jgi:anti-sigma B factor antagonist
MGFAPQFSARLETRNRVASISLSGELDVTTVPVLEDHLARFETAGVSAIMIDLRELTFLDRAAMQTFLAARERANQNGHRLILVGASPGARRLFELTNTEFLLDDGDTTVVMNRFTGGASDRAYREPADAGVEVESDADADA